MRLEDKRPSLWVSYWMAFSAVIVTWGELSLTLLAGQLGGEAGWGRAGHRLTTAWFTDAAYCFFRPRSFTGGDLAWIWAPYNMVPYSMVDYLYGQPALDSKDGFTNAQALLNVIEVLLALEYLYLRHTSPRTSTKVANPRHRYHGHAPLVGFAGALMTVSKTALYFLQEYFCGWCMVGHNDRRTFWTVWVLPNG
nr:uncharacterized protein CI109_006285 [Kwoniella shandongensis]KAA5525386.1 hypothetical protein CI109_006285 [Kwoniella shandongensis]